MKLMFIKNYYYVCVNFTVILIRKYFESNLLITFLI